jgi:transposase
MESIKVVTAEGKEGHETLSELLGLADFRVIGYEMYEPEHELILLCEVKHEMAICPDCQQPSTAVHEYKSQMIRYLSVFGMRCRLDYVRRRFKCQLCRKPFTEVLSRVSQGRYTARYERYIFEQYRQATIAEMAAQEGLGYKAAQGIFYRQAQARLAQVQGQPVRRLGLDEISLKKGHQQFMLVLSDLDRHCVIATLEDRHMDRLEGWFKQLPIADRQAIGEVSMDMWSPYRSAVERHLPQAEIVADRFHVSQNLNRAVTKARRAIQRAAPETVKAALKGARWVLVKNQANLSEPEQAKLALLYETSPDLKQLHQLKEAFRDIFEADHTRDQAALSLAAWMDKVQAAGLHALQPFLTTLDNWRQQVLNYFNQHTSQGFVEGMNNRIKLIMRRGFGYRNFDRFCLRILIECGLLP